MGSERAVLLRFLFCRFSPLFLPRVSSPAFSPLLQPFLFLLPSKPSTSPSEPKQLRRLLGHHGHDGRLQAGRHGVRGDRVHALQARDRVLPGPGQGPCPFSFSFFFFSFRVFSLSRARASEKGEERVSLFFPSSPLSFSFRWLSFRTSAAYILEKAKEKKRSLARRKRESKWKILFLGSEEKTPRSQPLFLIPSSTLIKLFILILKNLTTEKNRQSAPTSSSSAPRTTPRAPRPPASSSLN